MKLAIRRTTQFKRDVKQLLRRGKDAEKLLNVVSALAEGQKLSPEYHDHSLSGEYKN